ncbi:MAG: recombinase family protein, partial [Solirubrobacteraceae bacterium]
MRSYDTLLVWRLDRLGRNLRHPVDVIAALEQRRVAPFYFPGRHGVLRDRTPTRQGRTLVRFLGTVVCVEKLTFRFEDEEGAVILDGWAHRPGCPR